MELRGLRKRLGLSQKVVAEKLGTTQQTLNRYETGVNEPNIEMLCKLSDFYHVSIDTLLGRECEDINLRLFDDNRRALLKELAYSDDYILQRVQDFYAGIRCSRKN